MSDPPLVHAQIWLLKFGLTQLHECGDGIEALTELDHALFSAQARDCIYKAESWYVVSKVYTNRRLMLPITVGQNSRHGYAGGSNHSILILHSLDFVHGKTTYESGGRTLTQYTAFCGR